MQVYIIIACVVTLVVAAPVTWLISTTYHKKVTDKKIGSAEAKAREIIEQIKKLRRTIARMKAELRQRELNK